MSRYWKIKAIVAYMKMLISEADNIRNIVNGTAILFISSYFSIMLIISFSVNIFLLSMYSFDKYFDFIIASVSKNPRIASFIVAINSNTNTGIAIFVITWIAVNILIVNQYSIIIFD